MLRVFSRRWLGWLLLVADNDSGPYRRPLAPSRPTRCCRSRARGARPDAQPEAALRRMPEPVDRRFRAPLARDLRVLVRERLQGGDSDAQALAFIVARYGNFVLLKPPLQANTLLLWLGPALLLLLAATCFGVYLRRARQRLTEPKKRFSSCRTMRKASRRNSDRRTIAMMLWIILTVMTASAAVLVAAPFLRGSTAMRNPSIASSRSFATSCMRSSGRRRGTDRHGSGRCCPHRDHAPGAGRRQSRTIADQSAAHPSPNMAVIGIAGIVVLGSVGLYALNGRPELPSGPATSNAGRPTGLLAALHARPAAARWSQSRRHAAGLATVDEMIERLAFGSRLQPDDPEGWRMLGWSLLRHRALPRGGRSLCQGGCARPGLLGCNPHTARLSSGHRAGPSRSRRVVCSTRRSSSIPRTHAPASSRVWLKSRMVTSTPHSKIGSRSSRTQAPAKTGWRPRAKGGRACPGDRHRHHRAPRAAKGPDDCGHSKCRRPACGSAERHDPRHGGRPCEPARGFAARRGRLDQADPLVFGAWGSGIGEEGAAAGAAGVRCSLTGTDANCSDRQPAWHFTVEPVCKLGRHAARIGKPSPSCVWSPSLTEIGKG